MSLPEAKIMQGDVLLELANLADESVNCCVTSPPYWGLRNYGVDGQMGLESTPEEYLAKMVNVFREVRRVLRRDGVCFVNLGDSYAGGGRNAGNSLENTSAKQLTQIHSMEYGKAIVPAGLKPKDLIGMPWRLALALQADGWWLRQDLIWHKPNPMPESVTDRCSKAHEYIFLLTKSARYWWDQEAISEPSIYAGDMKVGLGSSKDFDPGLQRTHPRGSRLVGEKRNRRSVWTIPSEPYPDAHFATFPTEIPKLCILAGCPVGGVVLDPFAGSGTTGAVALELGRNAVLIELNPAYVDLIRQRLAKVTPGLPLQTTERK